MIDYMTMNRVRVMILLALAGLLMGATEADREREACMDYCRDQSSRCMEECGRHHDPVECDSECRDDFQDCERECS